MVWKLVVRCDNVGLVDWFGVVKGVMLDFENCDGG